MKISDIPFRKRGTRMADACRHWRVSRSGFPHTVSLALVRTGDVLVLMELFLSFVSSDVVATGFFVGRCSAVMFA
ncbi:hypothetical protein E0H22_10775 [Rhodopseudomonas boonkerdii]|uniref:hypothetical protein n=1 Tax=Rhodopseudomonas boonkerdii TaxID=475937 RepID=UPI001E4D71D0|nr:hypothetical protein [Rhodopseudomonas boonkerdii]UGV26130.1 hypothetical protein E0H22_10775 [Rhodopseudomonas boonkerdii]